MSRRTRIVIALATLALAVPVVAAAKAGGGSRKDSGTAYFSITHTKGTTQVAAGNSYDKVLGTAAVTYELKLSPQTNGTVNVDSKKVVLYTGTGSLTGSASAIVTGTTVNGVTQETISGGKLTLKKGSGSLKGGSLIATFSGTADLTKNQYAFTYKGTLVK